MDQRCKGREESRKQNASAEAADSYSSTLFVFAGSINDWTTRGRMTTTNLRRGLYLVHYVGHFSEHAAIQYHITVAQKRDGGVNTSGERWLPLPFTVGQ